MLLIHPNRDVSNLTFYRLNYSARLNLQLSPRVLNSLVNNEVVERQYFLVKCGNVGACRVYIPLREASTIHLRVPPRQLVIVRYRYASPLDRYALPLPCRATHALS